MKVVVLNGYGGPSVLTVEEREVPEIAETEVLIKVAAAGLNRADIAQREGRYRAPEGVDKDIPGLEVSGVVVEVGDRVDRWKVGDSVCALLAGGGYAEYVRVDASNCLPIPRGFGRQEAAAVPEVLATVWLNLFQIGGLKKEQSALIYGGSGGIGSMAIQLVRLFGARAVTLAGSEEKIEFCRELGAEQVVDYTKEDLVEVLGENSVDVVLEMIGGAYLNKNLQVLREEGRLIYLNSAVKNSELNIFRMMQKRITITGSLLRGRSIEFKADLMDDIRENAYPLIEHPDFKKVVAHRFSFTEVQEAHRLMDSGEFCGKIILTFDSSEKGGS